MNDEVTAGNPIGFTGHVEVPVTDDSPALEERATPRDRVSFPIVALGASAGGIEALTEFFSAVPADTTMAFVVILHLAADRPSALAQILARGTSLPVSDIEHKAPLEPGHVYVIPPGKSLVVKDGLLELVPRIEVRGQHLPIDAFLRSLAEEMGEKSIGVILSGTGHDGTLGLIEIKAEGGITFAQDDTAEHTSMPRSAVAAGCVDGILPPDEIAREIMRIGRHPWLRPLIEGRELPLKDQGIDTILDHLRHATGVDFHQYKYNTLQRRITRRMILHRLENLNDYAQMLSSSPAEVTALFQDILINVTSFFRNPQSYEVLKSTVFPALTEGRPRHETLRAWVLGCSTGEEAYSLAMAFTEYAEESGRRIPMQIFATDLNGSGIEKARAGVYSKGITQDVSPERLRRFFVEADGSFRVSKAIRDMCVFARHNVLTDPPFSRIDLVTCRNMLIYLESELQQRLMPILHYALRAQGYLWLGSSETVGIHRDLFDLADSKHKVYVRRSNGPHVLKVPVASSLRPHLPAIPSIEARPYMSMAFDPQKEADRALLGRYAPPAVIVDENLDILQFRGDTGPYISPVPGRATLSLLKMLREGLAAAVRGAVQRARQDNAPSRVEGLRVKSNGDTREVDVVVLPLKGPGSPRGGLLVVFEETSHSAQNRVREMEARSQQVTEASAHSQLNPDDQREVARLQQELDATRDYLQSLIEGHEAANQELQSANEEIQSANEELQSINEELETSKEEIQSSNEELATVNDELQTRNVELSQSNNDFTNLLNSVQMAIVMLGPDSRVRSFTPAAEKLFNLIPTDIGRPLRDLRLSVSMEDVDDMILAAMDTVSVQEREVQHKNEYWYSLRVRPYRTLENKIDGAVLMLIDVDAMKRTEQALRESEARFEVLADSAPVLIWVSGPQGFQIVNQAFEDFVGAAEAQLLQFEWTNYLHPEDREAFVGAYMNAITQRTLFRAFTRMRRADGVYRWMNAVGSPRGPNQGDFSGYVGCLFDITDLKEAQDRLQNVDRRKNEFLGALSHELRNPLAALRNASHLLALGKGEADVVKHTQGIIERQTMNMVRLVDDLLDVTRITQGKIHLRQEAVDVVESVRHAIAATKHNRDTATQNLKFDAASGPIFVLGDTTRLDQIFVNLLTNACKFTPPNGSVWIGITHDKAARSVEIHVRDDGDGIDPAILPRIFDLFVQGVRPTGKLQAGVGIGLTVVKHLVEMHGGEIEAHSAGSERGSEFVVRLPTIASPATRAARIDSAGVHTNGTRRVLIVDDNADAAYSGRILLENAGHVVRVAANGEKALEMAREFRPEVVLLDIGLPGENGYEIARRLRADKDLSDLFIIALTGFGRAEDVARSREAGFDLHLTKPADMTQVLSVIAARFR